MKLNKNGWGTLEMLLLSGGLLIALIVSIFFISKLYGSLSGAVGNRQYIDMENKLENAASEYVNEKEIQINGEYKITLDTLQAAGFIDELKDIDNKNCYGYVKITNVDNINHYSAYITCNGYETINY